MSTPSRFRPFTFGVTRATVRDASGTTYLQAEQTLAPYATRMTDRLVHWASTTPDRAVYARRAPVEGGAGGDWQHLTFKEALEAARCIGQALLDRGLNAERPLAILSENSLEHAMLALGAMYAGVPYCAVSPPYSLISQDFDKLRHVLDTLTPGLVYASDWARYGRAIEAVVPASTEVVVNSIATNSGAVNANGTRALTTFDQIRSTPATPAVDAAMQATGPDTIVKFLFTSGSTKLPKAVINTQRMICANQVMLRETLAFLKDEPPVIVDWLPWNHTFGGNHNIGLTLFNGGSMYLDEGKPMPGGIEETVRNLHEISPTVYFNVPKGYESLLPYLRDDGALRAKFFGRLHAMFFSGAALSPFVWNSLDELAVQEKGYRVPMLTGLGATETSPFFMSVNPFTSRSGHVGLPVLGNEAKLVPANGKLEVRARGPNVTPGYWRQACRLQWQANPPNIARPAH